MRSVLHEFLLFGLKQARACLFPALFFGILILSSAIPLGRLPRADFIFLAAVGVQVVLVLTRIESKREVGVLCAFHALGLVLELFKTHPAIASWSYRDLGVFTIGRVPLYSGFMYASVASYMCQSWRILDLQLVRYPSYLLSVPLSILIYLNFFTHHYIVDVRWWLILAVFFVYRPTQVQFRVTTLPRSMPLVVSFVLIGFHIWIAENIGTWCGAWVYPDQQVVWRMVSPGKITSWFLLAIISFIIVADLKHIRQAHQPS